MIAATLLALCSWNNPGADPTTTPVPVTLQAMGINNPELARKISVGEYDQLVTIHKNDSRLYGMTNGKGKWCDGKVDTSKWKEGHEEQGRVYRVGTTAVVWMWRCKNMSLWILPEQLHEAPEDLVFESPGAGNAELAGVTPVSGVAPSEGFPVAGEASNPSMGFGGFGAGGGGFVFSPSCNCVVPLPCPASAVPEPGSWFILLAGLAVIYLIITRRK